MRPRPDKRKQHPKVVTYFRPIGSDGWRVEMNQGARIVRRLSVDTKAEAIAAAKQLLNEWPGSAFELCVLGRVYAWWDDGWHYSRKERDDSMAALLYDEMGVLMLEVKTGDGIHYDRDATCED
ncbi:MAG: hypothetical protein C0485_05550 [Pirellula sp.]|nr:hypothetical protein [Pirellula sp.]